MPRVKRAVAAHKKRRKVLEQAKGYWGRKSTHYRYAKEQVEHSLVYAYRDRKVRKREFRKLWITRINAAARANGLSYNQFVHGCSKAGIELDRKVLADLAVSDPAAFGAIAEQAKAGLEPDDVLVAGEDVEAELLAEVSTLAHPPRVVAVFRRDDLPRGARPVTLALWHVGDPGNVGTLLRAAAAFAAGVALSEGCADPTGPKAVRASMGSIFRVPLSGFDEPAGRRVALVPSGGD